MSGAGFERLIHADWSAHAPGRWAAAAARVDGEWHAAAPIRVPPLDEFVDDLFANADEGPLLAGFDIPIGLPIHYGARTGYTDFPAALASFTNDFYAVAAHPGEIGLARPFYPARSGGASRQHLLDGHGVVDLGTLTRRCERGGNGTRAASCLFWTLGAAQVGKAALNGWRHVVGPARLRGARLWPFDGDLGALGQEGGLTLAETYPADGYARLGAGFHRNESKRRHRDRAAKSGAMEAWARRRGVALAPALVDALRDGFGPEDKGGDRFDAVVGLLAMIDVLLGLDFAAPQDDDVRRWEGWILGRGVAT